MFVLQNKGSSSLSMKVALFMMISGVSGCAFIPDNIQPHATILHPAVSPQSSKSTAKPLTARWWTGLNDAQLNHLVAAALINSPSLKQAQARVRQAFAEAGQVESAQSVQVNANASAAYQRWSMDDHYGGGLYGERTWNNSATLQLSYHLDFFHREKYRHRQAQAKVAYTQASAKAAQLDLEGNLIRTYVQFTLDYRLLDVYQARLAQQRKIVQLNQQRLTSGLGSLYELQQAQAQIPVIEENITTQQEAIQLTRNQLVTLAGLPLTRASTLTRPVLDLTARLQLPKVLPLNLIGQRPDLVASRWQIVSSARGVDLAKADFYPNVNLQAMVGQVMTLGSLNQWVQASNREYSAGPAISLPILDGGAHRAQLGLATARYDEVVETYNGLLQNALKSVSDQLIRQKSEQQKALLANHAVYLADKVYQTAQEAYRVGLRGYLHVLDAQTRLFGQELARETVHANLLQTQVSLAIALGGGIEFSRQPNGGQSTPQAHSSARQ